MNHLFVPLELARLAHENPTFDEPCLRVWIDSEDGWNTIDPSILPGSLLENAIAAPLYQQLVDWFDTQHGIYFVPAHRRNGEVKNYWYSIAKFMKGRPSGSATITGLIELGCHTTNQEALNAALLKAFTLI